MMIKSQKGFTLIELLLVIAILAILSAVVIVALNPARQFAAARNSQRVSNVNTVLNAVGQRLADNNGNWGNCGDPLPLTPTEIGSGPGDQIDIFQCLIPTYMAEIVMDPAGGTEDATGYFITEAVNGRITIHAPLAELGEVISVSR